nr:Rne/Rng family ribonuclease [Bifidobacterium catenulatum]
MASPEHVVNVVKFESAQSDSAPRRRRGGRRVVRGVGAAGASLELKVEEHAATPLFEEPKLPVAQPAHDAGDVAVSGDDGDSDGVSRPTRRRRRSARPDDDVREIADEQSTRTRRRRAVQVEDERDEESFEERALDAVDMLPEGHEVRHNPRPMMSLLFQEPVLPSVADSRNRSDDDRDDSRESRNDRNMQDHDDAQDEGHATRRRRRRNRDVADEGRSEDNRSERNERDNRNDDAENDEEGGSRKSHRSRRLNAQERRAAAEVEQIEEDLILDDITYAPIDDETRGSRGDDDDDEQPTRTRRRRRGRGNREEADEQQQGNVEGESRRRREEDDEEEGTVTRRRRRRRGGAKSEEQEEPLVRRSRKQQYIDEITDVEGSTRLEAKKQRRRDNRRERSRQSQLMEQDFLARREHVDRLMVVRERERHTQISVIEDNVLVEHYVSDIQEVATVGNIYLGRVQNVLPSMEAAFVDIGQARNGVLYAGEVNWDSARLEGQPRRIELAFKSGDPVLVQVTKDPIGHKGARLTSQVTLAGRFLVLVPSGGMTGVSRKLSERERSRLKNIVSKVAPKDMGVIIRTAAEGASEEAITKDLESLVRQWERITAKRDEFLHGKRPKLLQGEPDVAIRVVRDIFNDDFSKMIVEGDRVYGRIEEYLDTMAPDLKDKLEKWDPAEHEGKDVFDKWQIDSQLRKGMERQVYLPSGGSIVIDRTEAMTTIDVNTGRFIGRGKSLEETVTRCNLEASEEIARQLRLRDIGGMVMIDFVDMVMPANRDLVLRRLVECLARDRTKHQVAEVTSLGLVQMTRKRIGQGLVEAFSEECPTCKGRGFILHDEPTVSADYDDPYALKGGDPFVKTNKHGHGTDVQVPKGSSPDVKAKLAQIAAAAVAANNAELGEEA